MLFVAWLNALVQAVAVRCMLCRLPPFWMAGAVVAAVHGPQAARIVEPCPTHGGAPRPRPAQPLPLIGAEG
jgi:hypothetical protein